jgi:hypothetical protein
MSKTNISVNDVCKTDDGRAVRVKSVSGNGASAVVTDFPFEKHEFCIITCRLTPLTKEQQNEIKAGQL